MRMTAFILSPGLAVALVVAAAGAALAASQYQPRDHEDWITYENDRYGYSLSYPAAIFEPGEPAQNGDGITLYSDDQRAKVVLFGVNNSENFTPTEYRRVLLEEFGGYDQLDYSPVSRTWFVLSGYRGENIYYQKVMFTCSNKIISVFSMTFPADEKPYYERLVELMEDRFRPGREGDDTPEDC